MTVYKASIIIPYYQAHETIKDCLKSLITDCNDYQIILVDDNSTIPYINDQNLNIDVIRLNQNIGPSAARNIGLKMAKNNICLFLDSDVIVKKEDIALSIKRFKNNPEVSAFTCQHEKYTPINTFWSKYKSLYMNYTFSLHKNNIHFIYGSYCGLKKDAHTFWPEGQRYGEDTLLAMKLIHKEKSIAFYDDIETVHLKKYSFISLLKNDFNIPFHFSKIFLKKKYQGTFSHTNKTQLLAIAMTTLPILWPIWIYLNRKFFKYLKSNNSTFFTLKSILFTFIDQFTMGLGIFIGLTYHYITCNREALYKYQSPNY